jgi:hypothetical protein
VKPNSHCEQVRLNLMAAFDEGAAGRADPGPEAREHLATCSACEQWLRNLESLDHRLQGLSYLSTSADLWPAVERSLRPSGKTHANLRRFFLISTMVFGWRALQLFVDLPLPFLHSLVPLAAILAAFWQLARDPLAIQTFAPELQKRDA